MTTVRIRVLIVGAGIAGLAAARALKKCGHEVEIFERSHFSNEVGAAVLISTNGVVVLEALDYDASRTRGVNTTSIDVYNASTLDPIPVNSNGHTRKVVGYKGMHRQDLHSELERLALLQDGENEVPVKLHLGAKVIRIDTQKPELELDNGTIYTGDLLIGADGIHSAVRSAAIPNDTTPINTEWQIYRFLLPTELVKNDQAFKEINSDSNRCVIYSMPDVRRGDTARLIWYGCRDGEVQNFAALYRGNEEQTLREDFHGKADTATALKLFGHFDSKLLHLFSLAPSILTWRVYERQPLKSFSFGRTLLIGDAGHPMTPFTAQGAVMALEDAGALLNLFPDLTSKDEVPERMRLFDQVRNARATRVQLSAVMPLRSGSVNPLLEMAKGLELKDSDYPKELIGTDAHQQARGLYEASYNVLEKSKQVLMDARGPQNS